MTVGNEPRKGTGRNDALSILAIGEVKKLRQESGITDSISAFAISAICEAKDLASSSLIFNCAGTIDDGDLVYATSSLKVV